MGEPAPNVTPPDYGLDAPGVVRNLLLVSVAGLGTALLRFLDVWSGLIVVGPLGGVELRMPLATIGPWVGLGCGAMGLWMVWTSKVGKIREREALLDYVAWTGREQVLDVGCGRGLMLVGAARRLTTGKATGVDIWQAEDLSGNRPESTLENARREGVADRVRIETADMRRLPFGDGAFDVVLSSAAIHNLYSTEERATALRPATLVVMKTEPARR